MKFPKCHERVLCIKRYIDDHGLTDPDYCIDEGFVNAYGDFVWKKGGIVLYWMDLPPIPEKE